MLDSKSIQIIINIKILTYIESEVRHTLFAIERPGLESQRSRKRLFSTERFSNSLILKEIFKLN